MRRAAKALSAVVVLLAVVAGVSMTWFVHAQDVQQTAATGQTQTPSQDPTDLGLDAATVQTIKTMSWDQAGVMLDPARDQGRQAVKDGQFAWAAARFKRIAEVLPASPGTADAWFWAAISYGRMGSVAEAKAACDNTVSICKSFLVIDLANPPTYDKGLPYADSLKDQTRRALRYKAELCKVGGQNEEALATIARFRAEDPEYHYLRKLLPLQAELQGVDPNQLKAEEAAAWKLSDEAKWALGAGNRQLAQTLAQQVIDVYPESAGALIARNTLASALWAEHRYPEANAVYQQIRDRVASVAPSSELARAAAWHIAWFEVNELGKKLIVRGHDANSTEADWQRAHDLCDVIRSCDPEDIHRAEMTMLRGELYYWREQYPQAVAMLDRMLQEFEGKLPQKSGTDAILLKNIVMMGRQFAGFALLKDGKSDEAIARFSTIVEACKDDPNAVHGKNAIAAGACLGMWQAYSGKSDQDGMQTAERLMRDRWPDSDPARYLSFWKDKRAAGR